MRQSTLNRIFGTIFGIGLVTVFIASLYAVSVEPSAIEKLRVSQLGNYIIGSTTKTEQDDEEASTATKFPLTFIPPIGLGTWLSKPDEVTNAVKSAIDVGYRHIDTAKAYHNEQEVGKGIRLSGVPRNEIWVTSKLFNDDHQPEDVEPAIRKTLSDLGLEYLDLYLMHWPVALKDDKLDTSVTYTETWHAMERLVHKGLTKNIGISNFAQHQVRDILSSYKTIRPTFHEFETHPYLQQQSFVDWHLSQGIQVIAYSPFANLNPRYRDHDEKIPSILDDPFWITLAERKNATVPQTILAWGMQRGTIVIPKSVHEKRILENYASKAIRFDREELDAVSETNKELRLNDPGKGWGVDLFDDLEGHDDKSKEDEEGGNGEKWNEL